MDYFFEDYLPCFHVGSYVVECAAVDLNVQRRVWRTIQNRMEGHIPAQTMRKKKATHDTFVNYVQSSCIMEIAEV